MAIRVKIETPIAFGLTLTVCFVLFFYCWRNRKIRGHRLITGSVQVSALPITDTAPAAEEQIMGIKKDVIATFPTVKAHKLKDESSKEGCPICLVEYASAEVLRKLPLCGHVFHMRCVDSWLEKQATCPVCRIVLTVKRSLQPPVPAWVLVNRPLPLPPSIDVELRSRSPSDVMASPLLEDYPDIEIQTREHAAISDRWMAESFVFGMTTTSGFKDLKSMNQTNFIMENSNERSMEWMHMAEEVVECRVAPFRPLTMSPERCSFEFLPVVTTPFTPPPSAINWV